MTLITSGNKRARHSQAQGKLTSPFYLVSYVFLRALRFTLYLEL